MTFAWPLLLWSLLLVPAAIAAHVLVQRRRMRYAVHFTNLEILARVVGGTPAWRRHVPAALFVLALSALLLGVARPHATVLVPREQATVVLSIDVSGSMRATDVEPSRLSAAQSAAQTFVDQLPEKFQVGLVTFSDEAEILSQPTIDRLAVREGIDSLEAEGATAMGDAIVEALKLSKNGRLQNPGRATPRERQRAREEEKLDAILLLSDGYNTSGEIEPLEAAARARSLEIPVFTIALGTPEGVVETPDAFGRPQLVRVPPDYETLRKIAETTEAEFFSAPSEDDLKQVYNELASRIGFVKDRQEVTFAFAAAGLVLAAAGASLSALWTGRFP